MCASMCSRVAAGEGNERTVRGVAAMPARSLRGLWEVLEMDIQDVKNKNRKTETSICW